MTGLVIKTLGRYYTVYNGSLKLNCVLRGKLKQHSNMKKYTEPVAVGDIVDFAINDDGETGVINIIYDRRNAFTRMDNINKKEDLLAANIDLIVVVQSFAMPRLNLRFVDRLMVRGEKEHIPVVLCANKADLAKKKDIKYIRSYYSGTDLEIVITSAVKATGLNELKKMLTDKVTIFVGSSGVGKSSVLNGMYPELDLRISEVSESTQKGKHTTTNAQMVMMDNGSRIIDTPGMREFGLMDIEPHFLGRYFYEFEDYVDRCKFQPCTHDHEPECEIKYQVEQGNISQDRYVSYLNILNSLKEYYDRRYQK